MGRPAAGHHRDAPTTTAPSGPAATAGTTSDDAVRGVAGSTRLEAKRQRRRDGRDTGRRRAPILTESEFLARREAVDRAMVIRQRGERTQIAVLEDDVLVEHYVTQAQATSFAGNVYLGRVQNVLPSMEAAFVDVGKGRNAVLYAGEVNWETAGLSGKSRSIEQALKSGDKVLVQVTKDPIGHKGARLTQQINLPGRFLVYVPGGSMTGISRKLPDNERQRLKDILKKIVPEDAGVIIRTAAEGASEEELTRDVARLQAQWEVIQTKAASTSNAPTLLYGEPDLAIRVIRDVFNEDFKGLVVQGDDAWDTVEAYVAHVSPELSGRLQRLHRPRRRLPRPADRRAAAQGAGPQGLAALGWLAGHRPHRGDDRRRRQHRQVHRLRRQPRADGHPEQHRGRRGDRPPAPAARHRRHDRHRLHRHGAGEQPGPGPAPAHRVPGPRPHQAPGRRGHLAGPGPDDPQAGRPGPARGVLRDLRALPRSGRRRADRTRSDEEAAAAATAPAARQRRRHGGGNGGGGGGGGNRRRPAARDGGRNRRQDDGGRGPPAEVTAPAGRAPRPTPSPPTASPAAGPDAATGAAATAAQAGEDQAAEDTAVLAGARGRRHRPRPPPMSTPRSRTRRRDRRGPRHRGPAAEDVATGRAESSRRAPATAVAAVASRRVVEPSCASRPTPVRTSTASPSPEGDPARGPRRRLPRSTVEPEVRRPRRPAAGPEEAPAALGAPARPRRRRAASRPAGPPVE